MNTISAVAVLSSIAALGFLSASSGCMETEQALAAADSTAPASTQEQSTMVRVRVIDNEGNLVGPLEIPKVVKSDSAWQQQLSPEQYRIARGKGTERAFCGTLLDNKKDGVYTCVCCNLPLFSSISKFDSGTGWPSFFQPIAVENVIEHADRSHGMVRTEILCARCDAHLGHVFNDGPAPTGQRHCLNSESLTFTSSTDLRKLADPAASSNGDAGLTGSGSSAAQNAAASSGQSSQHAKAVFAGGCFWCVEAVFEELNGVIEAVSGYAGGTKETANYEAVCSGKTKHAEAVQILYDPSKISYEKLLEVHFATHDPTTLNRQGNDSGPQYRSAIFYADEQEKQLAHAYIEDLTDAKAYGSKPVVTKLEPLTEFYPAETYHQNYVCTNPTAGYVRSAALPKVAKVREKFKSSLKEKSPLNK